MSSSDIVKKIIYYIERYLPEPSPSWSFRHYRIRCYERFAAEDLMQAITARPYSDPEDILFNYVLESIERYKNCTNELTKTAFYEIMLTSQAIYEFLIGTEETYA